LQYLEKKKKKKTCLPALKIFPMLGETNNQFSLALLVEETAVPGENHQPAISNRQILSHNLVAQRDSNSQVRRSYKS
jgi:hypothetical protein